jgi:hypothetical protein
MEIFNSYLIDNFRIIPQVFQLLNKLRFRIKNQTLIFLKFHPV